MCSGFAGKKSANNAPAALCGHKAPFQKNRRRSVLLAYNKKQTGVFFSVPNNRPASPHSIPQALPAAPKRAKALPLNYHNGFFAARQEQAPTTHFFVPAGRKTLCPARIIDKGGLLAERRAPSAGQKQKLPPVFFLYRGNFCGCGFSRRSGAGKEASPPAALQESSKAPV